MATAEDDEMVLQEVVIDKAGSTKPADKLDSLKIPGASKFEPCSEDSKQRYKLLGKLSPKIAPKFPREKLKSMFKKRKLSSAIPFSKFKEVHFSRDTKDEAIGENYENGDLPVEVSITLSTPELTEIEKETGIHPYFYTQQIITTDKQLVTGKAVVMRQSSLVKSGSEEDSLSKYRRLRPVITRSISLPNLPQMESMIPYIHDPIILTSLRKIAEAKSKGKRKSKKRRRSSVLPTKQAKETTVKRSEPVPEESGSDAEQSRRNTLPQITLTECDQKEKQNLDLATTTSSGQFSKGNGYARGNAKEISKRKKELPQKSEHSRVSEKTIADTDDKKPQTQPSKSKLLDQTEGPKQIGFDIPTEEKPPIRPPISRRSPPPPRRPSTISIAARIGVRPTKKIAGISLKTAKPPTPDSSPTTPFDIPGISKVSRSSSLPKSSIKPSESSPSGSSKRSSESEIPQSTISKLQKLTDRPPVEKDDSKNKTKKSSIPPELPQRHLSRTISRDKK